MPLETFLKDPLREGVYMTPKTWTLDSTIRCRACPKDLVCRNKGGAVNRIESHERNNRSHALAVQRLNRAVVMTFHTCKGVVVVRDGQAKDPAGLAFSQLHLRFSDLYDYWRFHSGQGLQIIPEHGDVDGQMDILRFRLQATMGCVQDTSRSAPPCRNCVLACRSGRLQRVMRSWLFKYDAFLYLQKKVRSDDAGAQAYLDAVIAGARGRGMGGVGGGKG